jgi:dTDP-4-dehydrorhamnose reductase
MPTPSPILVTGASGTLGRHFLADCAARDLPTVTVRHQDFDLTSSIAIDTLIRWVRPWAVINAAGYVRVDDAESDAINCHRANAIVPSALAKACASADVQFLTFSSDLVFDGQKNSPYHEGDSPAPLSVYGRTKAEAEDRVLSTNPDALVIRTSAFFGSDQANFVTQSIEALARGMTVTAASDVIISPTYVPDLVRESLDLLVDGEHGIWHLANRGSVSWSSLATLAARFAGVSPERIIPVPAAALDWQATRPFNSALTSTRATLLPPLEDALSRWVAATPIFGDAINRNAGPATGTSNSRLATVGRVSDQCSAR